MAGRRRGGLRAALPYVAALLLVGCTLSAAIRREGDEVRSKSSTSSWLSAFAESTRARMESRVSALATAGAKGGDQINLLSLNLWDSLKRDDDGPTKLAGLIRELDIGVAAFQEVETPTLQSLGNELGPDYNVDYEAHIVSKYPIVQDYAFQTKDPKFRGNPRCYAVKLKIREGTFVKVVNCHFFADPRATVELRDGKNPNDVKNEMQDIAENKCSVRSALSCLVFHADNDPDLPTIFMGDHNQPSVLDHTEAAAGSSTYKAAHHSPVFPEVQWPISRILMDSGFTDAFRAVHPDPVQDMGFTYPAFPDSHPDQVADRIDYIYVKPGNGVNFQVQSAQVVGPAGSDQFRFSENVKFIDTSAAQEEERMMQHQMDNEAWSSFIEVSQSPSKDAKFIVPIIDDDTTSKHSSAPAPAASTTTTSAVAHDSIASVASTLSKTVASATSAVQSAMQNVAAALGVSSSNTVPSTQATQVVNSLEAAKKENEQKPTILAAKLVDPPAANMLSALQSKGALADSVVGKTDTAVQVDGESKGTGENPHFWLSDHLGVTAVVTF